MGLSGKKILLGVTGGIGAYKSALLVRELVRRGCEVSVVMTRSAAEFITPLTLEVLSGHPVGMELFARGEKGVNHIERARWADLLLVAPATANYLAKAACGLADDLLSTITLAVRCPVLAAPAMNTAMWEKAAVQKNVSILRERGFRVLAPGEGELACGEEGYGRMPEPEEILAAVEEALRDCGDLAGIRVLVTAGPTREPLDPVRFLSNRSSGKMGYALAEAAARRGAEVVLVTGPVSLPTPAGVRAVRVETAREMQKTLEVEIESCQWLVMAAAVADFAPAMAFDRKIKRGKDQESLKLVPNPDILKSLRPRKGHRLFIGFAAETEDLEGNAGKKLAEKGLDLIVANDVSRPGSGFESDRNAALVLGKGGVAGRFPLMDKRELAERVLDLALSSWRRASTHG